MPKFTLDIDGQKMVMGVLELEAAGAPSLLHDFTVPPASAGSFTQGAHDYQTDMFDRGVRDSAIQTEVPETLHFIQAGHVETIELTPRIAEFVLGTMMLGARISGLDLTRDQAIANYHEFTGQSVCLTDGMAWNTGAPQFQNDPSKNYHCVLTGMNPQNPLMRYKITVGFGGDVYRRISGTTIEAIDYLADLPDPADLYAEKPWLFQWLTQCYHERIGTEVYKGKTIKRYKVSRGPHFRPVGTLLPLFGKDGVTRFAEGWRMTPIANGSKYSPYVP